MSDHYCCKDCGQRYDRCKCTLTHSSDRPFDGSTSTLKELLKGIAAEKKNPLKHRSKNVKKEKHKK